uniref:hypothetical protein n=1 Tax=Yoonia sp. TaxID=2212373 RepID=UPI00404829E3
MTAQIRIRLFFEWGGGVLWCGNDAARQRYDVGPVEEKLGLPKALLAQLHAMSAHHDTALNWADPREAGSWSETDYAEFCGKVEQLRAEIAEAIGPEFEVVNEQFGCPK